MFEKEHRNYDVIEFVVYLLCALCFLGNDFEHSRREIQLCNETLQKHNCLIEEHWSGHNQLDESHKMLTGENSNLKISYY